MQHHFNHVDDVKPERLDKSRGWGMSEMKLMISGREGCSSTMYVATFRPGEAHHKHTLSCEEMIYVKRGRALAGTGDQVVELGDQDYHLIPEGVPHWIINIGDKPLEIIGFYDRAPSLEDTGHEFLGEVGDAELKAPRATDRKSLKYPVLNQKDASHVEVDAKKGWVMDHFCQPINGEEHGSRTCWMYGHFNPGHAHHKHQHEFCEEICFILHGEGIIGVGDDRVKLVEGHFYYIPAGVEHFMVNASDKEPIIGPGVYIGVNGLKESGHHHHGMVTEEDTKDWIDPRAA